MRAYYFVLRKSRTRTFFRIYLPQLTLLPIPCDEAFLFYCHAFLLKTIYCFYLKLSVVKTEMHATFVFVFHYFCIHLLESFTE